MDSATLTQLLYSFCALSVFLLIGTFLRGKIPLFRKLFLPASVIGGFVGLFLGPVIWGEAAPIPIPADWITTWSALPGILIVPVVASVPLGMKSKGGSKGAAKKASTDAIKMFAIISGIAAAQNVVGFFTQTLFNTISPDLDLYRMFGYELSSGFSGGHGTAGVVGSFYKQLELPYWEVAQGVTTTTATFGIIGGMIIGIIAINIAARKGQTAILSKPGDIPEDMAKGFQLDPEKQKSAGKEPTLNSSIDSLTFHLSVILMGCGISYIVMGLVKQAGIPGLKNVPIWAYAIMIMFGVNAIINKLNLGNLIDARTKSKISGMCSDYAITAAIASMPVKAVLKYAAPILFMVILGYFVTYFGIRFLCNKFFNDYQVERVMAILGTCTGVFLTGLMLLKICDPDYETPVINDFSIGFSFTSMLNFALMAIFVNLVLEFGSTVNIFIQLAVMAVYILIGVFAGKIANNGSKS